MPNKIGDISTGEMYGMSMDCLHGDVDSNGVLQNPSVASFTFTSNDIKILPDYALYYRFYQNTGITSLSLPNLTDIGSSVMYYAFSGCTSLTSVYLSSLSSVGYDGMLRAFYRCTSLTNVDLSSLSSVGTEGLYIACGGCTSLTNVDLSSLSSVGTNGMYSTFQGCTALQEVKFNNATAIPAITSNTFNNTNSTFKIVVPDALYSQWIVATNWSARASQIVKASEYI